MLLGLEMRLASEWDHILWLCEVVLGTHQMQTDQTPLAKNCLMLGPGGGFEKMGVAQLECAQI